MTPAFFTRLLQDTLTVAGNEAWSYNQQWVGTEHLLLALIRQEGSIGVRALKALGLDLSAVRSRVDFILRRGEGPGTSPPGLTRRPWRVVELALLERQTDNYPFLTTGHLLLGLLTEPEGIAGRVLEEFGADIDATRREVRNATDTMDAAAE